MHTHRYTHTSDLLLEEVGSFIYILRKYFKRVPTVFQLKCQTLGIIQCKDTIPDLQELTVNREADPNIAWWLPRLLHTAVSSTRGKCKLSAYGIWRSLYGVQDIWTVTWRRRRSLLSQERGGKKKKALPAEEQAKPQTQHAEFKKL